MSLLTVVRDVCSVVGVDLPTSIFSTQSTDRTLQELLSLANEMGERIASDTREWTQMKAQATFTGDGTTTAFDLPADYKRMLLLSNVWRSTTRVSPMRFVPDTDEWLNRRARNYYDSRGEWTMLGGQMLIAPALEAGVTATFPYLKKNFVKLFAGGYGDRFMSDGDDFIMGDRILKLGMTWQWKAQKGSPYAEDLGTYGDALLMLMGNNQPAPIIAGRMPVSTTATIAYPWPVPTP
jgi:hypothetical protein